MSNTMTLTEMNWINSVDIHANKYYNDEGTNWDVWVECYDDADKLTVIRTAIDSGDAIAKAGKELRRVSIY